MKQLILILICLVFFGCGRREEYKMSVSTSFSSERTEAVISAIETWEVACDIYIQVTVEDVSDINTDAIYPSTGPMVISDRLNGQHIPFVNKIVIYADETHDIQSFREIVIHELGHWLGSLHTEDPMDIMYPNHSRRDIARTLTKNDVEAACPWRTNKEQY